MIDDKRRQLIDNVRIAIAGCRSEHDVLASAVRLIDGFSEGYNWTGFYMRRGNHLEVGPYVGPETQHTRIELNQGICGAAATQKKSLTVDDVRSDPRFLACSASTRSELVVPLMDGDTCLGEIDLDSNTPSFFTRQDQQMLEAVAKVIVDRLGQLG